MAEIAVTAVITAVCEKLISGDFLKLAKSEGIDSQLKKWKKSLPMIQAVLADAAQKQIKERSVRLWLSELQDLAYDIDDVLDDLATEALRRKLNKESHASTSTSKVLKLVPVCSTNFTPRKIMYGRRMSSWLDEITTKLNDLVDQKNNLGLNVNVNVERSHRTEGWLEQTSLAEQSKIIGRDGDKEAMLGKLLGNEAYVENVSIVTIVGMGGIGKTTLAKVLYNDEKVKNHFEVRAWVCVSEELDVVNISKAILEAVGGEDKGSARLEPIHVAIKEKLANKRFLLVLDDVWNENSGKWKSLKSPLVEGAPGSRIMVTTRNTQVAALMALDEPYHLKLLSNEDALSLFAKHSLGEKNFDNHPELKLHGEGIVKKCGRLPLALETLGTALRRNRDGEKWKELLDSEEWKIKNKGGIIPALRLSYNHLPPHLKHLFAYCSLFPKDYVFDKNKLVLLWMAEGFLPKSNCSKSMESVGRKYFEELESSSFFQYSTNGELRYRGYIGYIMHDLINDLATTIAGDFFFRLDKERDESDKNETVKKLRHFSLIGPQCGSYRKLKELQTARHVRTFLQMSGGWEYFCSSDNALVGLLPQLQHLRVLSLAYQRVTQVPRPIGNLKHLRYLNFSYTAITFIPQEVSDLYNLQSLLVNDCYELSDLPEDFRKLINLRHLDITNTPKLKKMPAGIGGLTNLQTLSKVVIAGGEGFKVSELTGLSDLEGELSIMGLEKVIDPGQAKDANLHQKKGLDVLEMEWSDVFDDSRDERNEYKVLEGLKPHDKLKKLNISFYKGAASPSWVGDPSFDRLEELTLHGCRSTHFPTLGHLPSFKKLYVKGMKEVKTLDFVSQGTTFPSLEYLEFDDMQCWQRWSTTGGDNDGTATSFPRLREISIDRCPKLVEVSIGPIPSLRVLRIRKCSEALLLGMASVLSSLVELKIWKVEGLTHLRREHVMYLGAVKHLLISGCDELLHLWEPELEACKILVSLEKLEVSFCKKLVSLGEKEVNWESLKEVQLIFCVALESYNCPNSVERLDIMSCDSITSLSFSTVRELPSALADNTRPTPEKATAFLPVFRLRSLVIHDCINLSSFPHEHFQSFTSLEELWIFDCPNLDSSFPCGLWPPNLSILKIGGMKKPMSEWGFQNYPSSLVKLHLNGNNSGVVSFAVVEDERNAPTASSFFLLPPSLTYLKLAEFTKVESLSEVLHHLPCLDILEIRSCPMLKDQLERMSVPSSLEVRVYSVVCEINMLLAHSKGEWTIPSSGIYTRCIDHPIEVEKSFG